ncbi:MAG: glycerophosphodiester phosphodiesterase family protein [Vicinamibacterales bacterium]
MALVYAHRGGAALRPENSIAAFDHGVALGADGLEFDVHLSSDGVVVVHHDTTLERTTQGRGRVANHTASELAGLGVPLFTEVLDRYRGTSFIVELKVDSIHLVRQVIYDLRAAGAIERAALGCFHSAPLETARKLEPALSTGSSAQETRRAVYRSWIRWPLGTVGYREFQVPERSGMTSIVTPRFIAQAHQAGLSVKVWTVNDPADMRRLVEWGVDGLITDRPDLAVPIVRSLSPVDPRR